MGAQPTPAVHEHAQPTPVPDPPPPEAHDDEAKFDENVAQLVEMGFTHDQAMDALLQKGGNLEEALGLLSSAPDAEPTPAPSDPPTHGTATDAKFDESIAQIVDMGFTNDQAKDAL